MLKVNIFQYEELTEWIKIEDCKDGWLYKILARNAPLGIYCVEKKAFIISRFKGNANFLYPEEHWDTGEPFGTVKPITPLELAPIFTTDNNKLIYLNSMKEKYLTDKERVILW